MGGTGPPPKAAGVAARYAGRKTSRVTLTDRDPDDVEIPKLPVRYRRNENTGVKTEIPWHPMTLAWWNDIWPSPMAAEWHDSDVHGLYRLADLHDNYWNATCITEKLKATSEIRLAQKDYGLTPLDRRRLEWTVENTRKAQEEGTRRRRKATPTPTPGEDPRLRVV